MTIQEAIKSHQPFRRLAWTLGNPEWLKTDFSNPIIPSNIITGHDGYEIYQMTREGYCGERISLRVEDILANDWEIKQ